MTGRPVSLNRIQHIIDRVHDRYPLLSKSEITLIIRSFFECIRDILLSDNILSLNNFFSHMQIIYYSRIRKNKFTRIAKVKLSTSGKLKYE